MLRSRLSSATGECANCACSSPSRSISMCHNFNMLALRACLVGLLCFGQAGSVTGHGNCGVCMDHLSVAPSTSGRLICRPHLLHAIDHIQPFSLLSQAAPRKSRPLVHTRECSAQASSRTLVVMSIETRHANMSLKISFFVSTPGRFAVLVCGNLCLSKKLRCAQVCIKG